MLSLELQILFSNVKKIGMFATETLDGLQRLATAVTSDLGSV